MTEAIELDEPAANSHSPNGWPIKALEIAPSGKAPAKYGPRTYRFGAALTLSVILPRRGWRLVKKTKNYVYLEPPPSTSGLPFKISIAVPTSEECLAIAQRSYARGSSWMGQLGEWPAWYFHERNTDMQEIWRDPASGQTVRRLHPGPLKSSLHIGEFGVWSVSVTGEAGAFALGHLPPSLATLSVDATTFTPALLEGGVKTVELTTYERSPEARRLCLEHYGAVCQCCGMVYEDRYGPIGMELIHVHHVVPLAAIGETYQVDPVRDLVPLCANCHHVVHARNPPHSVAAVREAIRGQTACASNSSISSPPTNHG